MIFAGAFVIGLIVDYAWIPLCIICAIIYGIFNAARKLFRSAMDEV